MPNNWTKIYNFSNIRERWKKKIFHENQAAAKNLHSNESQRTLEMFTISLGYFSMAKHKKGD